MRNPEEIKKIFFDDEILESTRTYLMDTSPLGEHGKIEAAFHLLDINKEHFTRINSAASKKHFLEYKYLQTEFEFNSANFAEENHDHCAALHRLALLAARVVEKSFYMKEGPNPYSPYSHGLVDMDIRNVHYVPDRTSTKPSILGSPLAKVGDKKGGVERGYQALLDRDIYLGLKNKYPKKNERLKIISQLITKFSRVENKTEELYKELKEELKLPKYLMKLVPHTITDQGMIVPQLEDLKRTTAMTSIYAWSSIAGNIAALGYQWGKTAPFVDVNIVAMCETLANDYAKNLGLRSENKTIYPMLFENFYILMLAGGWIDNLQELGGKGCLAGGKYEYDNLIVKKVIMPKDGISHVSDGDIVLAEHFALFLTLGDPDAIGRNGQNKGREDTDLIGFDWGHAWGKNAFDIIDLLGVDFYLPPEALKLFKNFSIFNSDAQRSHLMRGILKFARISQSLLQEEKIRVEGNNAKLYGTDFFEKLKSIEPNSLDGLFDDNIRKFSEESSEFKNSTNIRREKNEGCCDKLSQKAYQIYELDKQRRLKLIKIFLPLINLPPNLLDLMQNIELLFAGPAGTTLRSPDNKVLLNFLQLNRKRLTKWEVVSQDPYCLRAIPQGNEQFSASKQAVEQFKINPKIIQFSFEKDKTITITIEKPNLSQAYNLISQKKLKSMYHRDDADLQTFYKNEESLTRFLTILKSKGKNLSLGLDSTKTKYVLTIPKRQNYIDVFIETIKKSKNCQELDSHVEICFSNDEIESIKNVLLECLVAASAIATEPTESQSFDNADTITSLFVTIKNLLGDILKNLHDISFLPEQNQQKGFYNLAKSRLNDKIHTSKADVETLNIIFANLEHLQLRRQRPEVIEKINLAFDLVDQLMDLMPEQTNNSPNSPRRNPSVSSSSF